MPIVEAAAAIYLEPKKGNIVPPVLPVDQDPITAPDLEGPGQPPRKIDIGGGLHDFGGEQIPPSPPTAEGDDLPEDVRERAERFSQLWSTPYPGCNARLAIRDTWLLLNASGLMPAARKAVLTAYQYALSQETSPGQVIPTERFHIEIPFWRVASLGIFAPDKDLLREINTGLLRFYTRNLVGRDIEELAMLRQWREQIAEISPDKMSGLS